MRCYLVTTATSKQYAGTQAEVASLKKAAITQGASRKDIMVKEVEVPVAKAELISFINKLIKNEVITKSE